MYVYEWVSIEGRKESLAEYLGWKREEKEIQLYIIKFSNFSIKYLFYGAKQQQKMANVQQGECAGLWRGK